MSDEPTMPPETNEPVPYDDWAYQNPPLLYRLLEEIRTEPDAKRRKLLEQLYDHGLTAPPHIHFKFAEGNTPLNGCTQVPVFSGAYDYAGRLLTLF